MHFEASQFKDSQKSRLNWNAIPTLFDVPTPPALLKSSRPSPAKRPFPEDDTPGTPVKVAKICELNVPGKLKIIALQIFVPWENFH